jgi:hypothetical protein
MLPKISRFTVSSQARNLCGNNSKALSIRAAVPVSGKFKILHGFNVVLTTLFHFGRIFTRRRRACVRRKPRFSGLRAFALRPHRPRRGRRVLLRNPYNRLRANQKRKNVFDFKMVKAR